ncbi:MAG: hypothetical protein ACT4NY_05505 [Pseudonocardiales bacterium]
MQAPDRRSRHHIKLSTATEIDHLLVQLRDQWHLLVKTDNELQRAGCWLTLNRPERTIQLYAATIPELPVVYRRDRGMDLSRFAVAYVDTGEPEQAARVAAEALSIAQSTGSTRTFNQVVMVARRLMEHQKLPPVAQFLDELTIGGLRSG